MNETRPAFAAIILMGFLLVAFLSSTPGHAQTLDEVYQKALTEGGTLNFYGTLAPNQASKILPVFEARFPGNKSQSNRRHFRCARHPRHHRGACRQNHR